MEMDCVSNGTGLCNIPDAGYDIPNDPDEPMPHYYAMLKVEGHVSIWQRPLRVHAY